MIHKWIGAVLTVAAGSFCGMTAAGTYRREEQNLRQLLHLLEWMICQLQCKAFSLPQLFRGASQRCNGFLQDIFSDAASFARDNAAPDIRTCVERAVSGKRITPKAKQILELLGASLGEFDLNGQLRQLESVRIECQRMLQEQTSEAPGKVRCCRTIGVCIGCAIAILLI